MKRVVVSVIVAVAAFVAAAGPACNCTKPLVVVDAGNNGVEGEGEGAHDAGVVDAGRAGEGEGEGANVDGGAGFVDAGFFQGDAGNGFDLGSFLDGGAGACLPDQLPQLSVTGALDALGLGLYHGQKEHGVICGLPAQRENCGESGGVDVPCCVLCGIAACGVDVTDAGAPAVCPPFTQTYACDDNTDCSGSDICCFTLNGTQCRPADQCDFNVNQAVTGLLEAADGGFHLRDAGFVDGGFEDGGFNDTFDDGGCSEIDGGAVLDGGVVDGGARCSDGGVVVTPVVGPAGPVPDAGSLLDGLQTALDQGVPVCTSTLFGECDVLSGQVCCTSDRLPAVDLGFCMPLLLCGGSLIP